MTSASSDVGYYCYLTAQGRLSYGSVGNGDVKELVAFPFGSEAGGPIEGIEFASHK